MGADLEIVIKGKDAGASKALSNVGDEMDGLQKRSSNLLSRGLSPLKDIMMGGLKVAAAGAATGLGALAAGIGVSVKAAMDMEQQLADISASMGTTSEETADLKKLITNLGLDPKLKVSATEAADAIGTLGTAGVSVTDILNGAARSTVLLANATGADFGSAAAIASDAMALWKVEAKDLNTVVNGVTSTTIASKFGINDYRLALAAAGGVAATVGVEFDDFNAVIATISPSFSSGSDAGTSFKTFLQRLVPQSNEARDAMRDLGLFTGLSKKEFADAQDKIFKYQDELAKLSPTSKNYEERAQALKDKITVLQGTLIQGSNAFFDANGNMKSMAEISGILNTALGGLSEEQKNEALSTIFGTDAMRAAAAMADTGKVKFESLKATMAKTDAEQQAATRMNTLKGVIEILSGVFETLKIQIGEKFLPVFTSLASKFGEFLTKHADQIVNWAGIFADNLEALANWVLAVAEDGDVMNDWLTHMHPSLQATVLGVASFVDWMTKTIPPIIAFVNQTIGLKGVLMIVAGLFAASFIPAIISVVSTIMSVVSAIGAFVGVLGTAIPALGAVVAAAAPFIAIAAAIGAALYVLYLAWKNNWLGIQDITRVAVESIKSFFVNLPATLSALGSQMYEVGRNVVSAIGNGINAAAGLATGAIRSVVDFISSESSGRLSQLAGSLYESGRTVISKIGEGFQVAKAFVGGQIDQVMTDIQNRGVAFAAGAFAGRLYEAARSAILNFGQGLMAGSPNLAGDLSRALDGMVNAFNGFMDPFKNHVFASASDLGKRITSGLAAINPTAAIQGVLGGLVSGFNQVMDPLKNHFFSAASDLANRISSGLGSVNMTGVIQGSLGGLVGAFNSFMDPLKNHVFSSASDLASRIAAGLASMNPGETMRNGLYGIIDAFNNVMDGFKAHVYGVMQYIGGRISDGLADGIRGTIQTVLDALNWITSYAPQWVKDALGIHSPSTVFAAIGQNIMAGLAQGIEQMTATPQLAMAGATSGLVGAAAGATINNSRTTTTNNTFNVSGGNAVQDPFEATRVLNALYGS